MKRTIQLDDDLDARIVKLAAAAQHKPETFLARYITQTEAGLDPAARALILSNTQRLALEDASQRSLPTGDAVVAAFKAFASLKLGNVEIPLTAVQFAEIQRKAVYNGKGFEEYCTMIFKAIAQEFLATV